MQAVHDDKIDDLFCYESINNLVKVKWKIMHNWLEMTASLAPIYYYADNLRSVIGHSILACCNRYSTCNT